MVFRGLIGHNTHDLALFDHYICNFKRSSHAVSSTCLYVTLSVFDVTSKDRINHLLIRILKVYLIDCNLMFDSI